ncbi:SPW repeat protein [Flavisolibacter sp. BT320]|nr:SPW repeat protein [Flavisolibacter longurius]
MRILSTKFHGYLDYLVGALLIAAPWIFDFARGGAETWVLVILGVSAILYSLLTDYEMGATKGISMRTHLTLDMLNGLILALSPWVFAFADYVYLPHLILGIMEIGVVLITQREPAYGPGNKTHHHRRTMHA